MASSPQLDGLIAALEAQRAVLGDTAVDFAIAALREKASSAPPPAITPTAAPKVRQVSVLFCDIAESTSMLQHLDTEDALAVVGEVLQTFATLVGEAGGKVLRFTGDGLKAAFGIEQAREDDAERAVRAGLAILEAARAHAEKLQRTLGVERFGVRVGINTGPVVLGGGPEADKTAMGHAVHIAARLEQSAPLGRLRIAHSTWRLVRGLFEVEPQEPLTVKGSDEPLVTYLVTRTAIAGDLAVRRGVEGVRPPLVGRDVELAALLAVVERARDGAATHATTVIGDAGLGKTRLLGELRSHLPAATTVLLAQAQPSSALQPYGLLRHLVGRWLGIADGDDVAIARQRLVAGLAPFFGDAGEAAAEGEAQRVGQLIGIDFSGSPQVAGIEGRELRERGFRALRRALHRLAHEVERAPLVLLLDDIHWADDGSLDFVEQLADGDAPIALVVLARPALLERRPAWLGNVERHAVVRLTALGAADGESLATALLGRLIDPPESLQRLLVARAEGNPFFMEELVRMLIDDGVIDVRADGWRLRAEKLAKLRVPETLVGVLQARLDALPPAELAALQQASIIGPVFWDDALSSLDAAAVSALPALERRSLVVARAHSAFDPCGELAFYHQLLHDVTYGTVLKAVRREGHGRAARWLAERVGERAGEFLGVTADHFERAGDSEKALDYFSRAASDAARLYAYEAVMAYTGRALAQPALAADPEHHFWLQSRRQSSATDHGEIEDRDAALAEMASLAEHADDDRLRAEVLSTRALQADHDGKQVEARALAGEAVVLAERAASPTAAVFGHGMLAWLAISEGDFETGAYHVEAGIPWARRTAELPRGRGGHDGYELQLRLIGIESLILQCRLQEASAELDRARELPGSGYDRFSLVSRRAAIERDLGDLEAAERLWRESLAITRELSTPRIESAALAGLAGMAELRGDAIAQRDLAVEAAAVARACDAEEYLCTAQAYEGSAWLALGDPAKARALLETVLARHRAAERGNSRRGALARLIAVDLVVGDLATALPRAEELLADQREDTLSPEVQHAVFRVLETSGDERAAAVLAALRERLRAVLEQIPDEAVRARVVSNLPHWRDVDRRCFLGGLFQPPAP